MATFWAVTRWLKRYGVACFIAAVIVGGGAARGQEQPGGVRHLLYVATPGVRDYLEYGGHGVVVFDIDHGHRFIKRIATRGLDEQGKPLNVKGICATPVTSRLYVSTTRQLMCLSLESDAVLWEQTYEAGCDRMSITADGKTIFLPSLEGPLWHVVDTADGHVIRTITTNSGAHNTICGLRGARAYLAGLKSPILRVADVESTEVTPVGPFSASVRPFTIDGRQRRCYVNVNELLGFEVGDLRSGEKLASVTVEGFAKGPVKRHGCPSHGIALTPDERELWLTDGHNQRLHVFDATLMPPKQVATIALRDEPGWVTFTIDGRYAYPSTGEVIETRTRRIVTRLVDEAARQVQSEKMVEVDFNGPRVVEVGNQFGVGRVGVDEK